MLVKPFLDQIFFRIVFPIPNLNSYHPHIEIRTGGFVTISSMSAHALDFLRRRFLT